MEGTFLLGLQAVRIGGLTQVMALLSALGNSSLIWIVLALVFLVFEERRETGMTMIVALIITSIVCYILTNIFARPCPPEAVTGLIPVVGVSHSGYSFPSLHAATAFCAVMTLWRSGSKGIATASFGFAILECISRMYLGVNYLTDVLVGAALGMGIAFLLYSVLPRILGRVTVNFTPRKPSRSSVNAQRGRHSR